MIRINSYKNYKTELLNQKIMIKLIKLIKLKKKIKD